MPDPWEQAVAEFRALKDQLKDTYREVANGDGPSEEEIKTAFSTLAGAWNQVAESVSTALSDPETREHLKRSVGSLATALGETLSQLGDTFVEEEDDDI